jgi:anti-anti-sigma regulatory factor
MGVQQPSEQILLITLPRETRICNELEIAVSMTSEAPRNHVIVDFSATQVLSSAMLSQLLILERQLDAFDRRLILCSVPFNIMELFKCVGLQALFRFADDQQAATESLGLAYHPVS